MEDIFTLEEALNKWNLSDARREGDRFYPQADCDVAVKQGGFTLQSKINKHSGVLPTKCLELAGL